MRKEEGFSHQLLINELVKSKHGSLDEYIPIGLEAANKEPEFLQRLITWNLLHGEIRDSKVALPVISLRGNSMITLELTENAIANLCSLDPRLLVKAYRFNKHLTSDLGQPIRGGRRRVLEEGLKRYIEVRETDRNWWDRVVLQHRASMRELYAVSHYKPSDYAQRVLFDNKPPKRSVFAKVKELKDMSPKEAAGTILNFNIPFQIAIGALGRKKKDYEKNLEFVIALMEGMSGQQLLGSTKFLASIGVMDSLVLKSEYNKAIERAKKDKKVSTLKAGKAIRVLEEAGVNISELKTKLASVQEHKIMEKGIEGDWLVLGDCSGSMREAIKMAKEIAAFITRSVKGKVYLIFFNYQPRMFDVTGKTLEEIQRETAYIKAGGATSCGCGVKYLTDRNIIVNGIALVSDGGDNTVPYFHNAYEEYKQRMGMEPTVYFYKLSGDPNGVTYYCDKQGIHLEEFDMNKVDYYSLPNIVSMMKTTRYSLIDEIMQTPFLTFERIFATK